MEEKIDFAKVPYQYSMCLNRQCPQAGTCLRQLTEQSVPENIEHWIIISPKYLSTVKGGCPHYRSSTKVRYAQGFIGILENLPYKQMQTVILHLMNYLGRRTYYRARKGEQQRQRHTRDDIGVRHRDVGQRHDGAAQPPVHVVDADRRHRAHNGRDERGEHGDDERVPQQRQQRAVTEQVHILPQRKALEARNVRAGIERRHAQHDHGDVEEDKDQNGHSTVKMLHTFAMTSSSPLSPKRFIMLTQRKIKIISTRLIAAPRFGL